MAAYAFVVLLLIIGAHTVLETARDAMLLAKPSTRTLGIVYLAVAALTLPSAALATKVSARFGARRGLVLTLVVASLVTAGFYAIPPTPSSAMVLYVLSGLIAAHLVPQFWALAGRIFTVTEGRRLIGPIGSAGVIGGFLGSSMAGAALFVIPVNALTLVASAGFLVAAGVLGSAALEERSARPAGDRRPRAHSAASAFRKEPFLWRIALLVVLSTASVLTIDYLFKWTVARSVPAHELGRFFALYYAGLNGLALLVQLFIGGALVRRMGVALASAITPTLLLFGALGVLFSGGIPLAVFALRGIDGSLRHSIHRITTELVYFPVPADARERAKPLIDGTLVRLAQALTAAALLTLGELGKLTPELLGASVLALLTVWLVSASTLRRRYLEVFRRTLSAGSLDESTGPHELDISSAEVLVERLASRDPADVVGAMQVLARRGRERLIPALVLYHKDMNVLVQALAIFGASKLEHWIDLAEPLLSHSQEEVRMAAARALASHGKLHLIESLLADTSSRVQGYATLHVALRDRSVPVLEHPRVAVLLKQPGDIGRAERFGFLAAIADAAPDARFGDVLRALATEEHIIREREGVELVARAATRQRDPRLIPPLIGYLAYHSGREAARDALVELGESAFTALSTVLLNGTGDRRVRIHVPRAIARFGTQRAADLLLSELENGKDGQVRYKALRGLGRLAVERDVRVDRKRVERLALANLLEHFRLLGLRGALSDAPSRLVVDARRASAASRLLRGLLDDKLQQSVERAFRLLKIAHRGEDIHRVYLAAVSGDKRARAHAAEFLDTLLARRDQQPLRALLFLVTEELPVNERAARASEWLSTTPPNDHDEALLALIAEPDMTVASLAGFYATAIGDDSLRLAVARARDERPSLADVARRMLELPPLSPELEHV